MTTKVTLLSGGTGGAKLAAGLQDLVGEELTVIANTGDDADLLGVHISPDPDLITYWLCGEIDQERGWGVRGEGFEVAERLHGLGEPDWFGLGDRDLATCLRRRRLLDGGARQTEAQLEIAGALGARARVLPMCDEPVRTRVRTAGGWMSLQEYMVRERAEPEIEEVAFEGVERASPSAEVLGALAEADAIAIGPSNPVISIGPILALPGMREALSRAPAPVVAVSPFVGGEALKGPTEKCMHAADMKPSSEGVATLYEEVADGLVVDEGDPAPPRTHIPTLAIPTLMNDAASRRTVAERTLEFAGELR